MKLKYTFFLLLSIFILGLASTKLTEKKADTIDLVCRYDNRSKLRPNKSKDWVDEKYINNKYSQNINVLLRSNNSYKNLNNIKSHVYYYKNNYYLLITADWTGQYKENINQDILKMYANDSTVRIGKINDLTVQEILYFINDYSASRQYTFKYILENGGYKLNK